MTSAPVLDPCLRKAEPAPAKADRGLERYYREAGPDYQAWSPSYNMHFGYFAWGMNPLDREAMLERMNGEVLRRLRVAESQPAHVVDLGCGLGATLRSIARQRPVAQLTGITLVGWQVAQGLLRNEAAGLERRIQLIHSDYEAAPLASGTCDAVYALESLCYGTGAEKGNALREAFRLLRPGGRLVIADAFLTQPAHALNRLQGRVLGKLNECWAIETLGEQERVERQIRRLGFADLTVEMLQYRVAPSFLHVPWVTARFLAHELVRGTRPMTRARWNNVVAPLLLPLLGMPGGPLVYCLMSATKT